MVQRLHTLLIIAFLGLAVTAGLFFIPQTSAAGEPPPLACPNKQTTFLSGSGATPGEALIAYLSARPVGGGSARADGSWRIPLLVNERPGVYPVEVKVRGTHALVASFTCYVDVPTETPIPGESSPEDSADTPIAVPGIPAASPSPAPGAGQPTPQSTATTTTATATRSPTVAPTTAVSGTATRTTTPTRTPVGQSDAEVVISEVVCRDPEYPDDSEYIDLRNDGTVEVDLAGWEIINTSRRNVAYTFPSYTMERGPNVHVTVWSGVGDDDPEISEFYWNRTDQLWLVGDQAELYDADGNLVDTYIVPEDNCP